MKLNKKHKCMLTENVLTFESFDRY